jgi:hypothetical protein
MPKGVEIDSFGNENQNELEDYACGADFNYGESATITRTAQS